MHVHVKHVRQKTCMYMCAYKCTYLYMLMCMHASSRVLPSFACGRSPPAGDIAHAAIHDAHMHAAAHAEGILQDNLLHVTGPHRPRQPSSFDEDPHTRHTASCAQASYC